MVYYTCDARYVGLDTSYVRTRIISWNSTWTVANTQTLTAFLRSPIPPGGPWGWKRRWWRCRRRPPAPGGWTGVSGVPGRSWRAPTLPAIFQAADCESPPERQQQGVSGCPASHKLHCTYRVVSGTKVTSPIDTYNSGCAGRTVVQWDSSERIGLKLFLAKRTLKNGLNQVSSGLLKLKVIFCKEVSRKKSSKFIRDTSNAEDSSLTQGHRDSSRFHVVVLKMFMHTWVECLIEGSSGFPGSSGVPWVFRGSLGLPGFPGSSEFPESHLYFTILWTPLYQWITCLKLSVECDVNDVLLGHQVGHQQRESQDQASFRQQFRPAKAD